MESLGPKTKSLIFGGLLFLQSACGEIGVNLGMDIDQATITNVLDDQNDYITFTYSYKGRSITKTVLKSQTFIEVGQGDTVFINPNNLTINFGATGAYRTSGKSASEFESIYEYAKGSGL